MTGIFGILESSATQCYQDVASTQEFFFLCHIYGLWAMVGIDRACHHFEEKKNI